MTKLLANPRHRAWIAAICQQFVVFAEPTSARVAGAEDFKIVTDQHGLLYDNSGWGAMTTERGGLPRMRRDGRR